jgi:hypothetical protein
VFISTLELKIYLLSSDEEDMCAIVTVTLLIDVAVETSHIYPQKCVAAVYENEWYIRYI